MAVGRAHAHWYREHRARVRKHQPILITQIEISLLRVQVGSDCKSAIGRSIARELGHECHGRVVVAILRQDAGVAHADDASLAAREADEAGDIQPIGFGGDVAYAHAIRKGEAHRAYLSAAHFEPESARRVERRRELDAADGCQHA